MLNIKHNTNFPFALETQNKINKLTPKIIRDCCGDLCYVNNEDIIYLTEFISNNKHSYTASEIGKILGNLHKSLFELEFDRRIDFIQYVDNTARIELLIQKTKNKLLKEILQYKQNVLNNFNFDIDFSKLNYQIIHGDFYKENLIYYKGMTKIIDFDQCCTFYREYEILRGFFMSLYSSTYCDKKNLSLFKDYIYSYKKINSKIDAINTYKLYMYILANSISGMGFPRLDIPFAKKRYEILKFLINNKNNLLEILDM